MALCFAHTAAGYLAYEAVRPASAHRPGLLAAAVLLANGPDLDFVPGILLGHPGAFHRGITHTVLAVVVVAAAVALGARLTGRRGWRAAAAWAGAVYASHLLLDFFTVDAVPPCGARFLWPFSDAYYLSPHAVLPEIIIDGRSVGGLTQSLITPRTYPVWGQEVALLVVVVAAVHAARAALARVAWSDARERS
jgi:membrane-bound metal-dependent hydrolase YbcI (DUF457 family)